MLPGENRAWRKEARARLLEARRRLTSEDRARLGEAITANLDRAMSRVPCRILGLYWPIKGEFDIRAWASRMAGQRGLELALPIVVERGQPLEYWRWRSGDPMARGFWGIMVPAVRSPILPDVVIAPLVGFQDGYRLGYGGGYFDRTLAALVPRPYAIGIGLEQSRLTEYEPQDHDIPMQMIVTEAAIEPAR